MNLTINQLNSDSALALDDKLPKESTTDITKNITGQMIVDLVKTYITLHEVLSVENIMHWTDLIKNTDMSGTLLLAQHYSKLYHAESAKLSSDLIARIEGADSSVEANNANVNITCSDTTTIDTGTLLIPLLTNAGTDFYLMNYDNINGVQGGLTLKSFANDGAAAAGGLAVGDVYIKTGGTPKLHTRMV